MKSCCYRTFEFEYYHIFKHYIDKKYSLLPTMKYLEDNFNVPYLYYDNASNLQEEIREYYYKVKDKLRFCL